MAVLPTTLAPQYTWSSFKTNCFQKYCEAEQMHVPNRPRSDQCRLVFHDSGHFQCHNGKSIPQE